MISILGIAGKIAGIGGLSIAVLLILFREIIRKRIFPNLTKQQGYKIIKLIIIFTFIITILGVLSWTLTKTTYFENQSTKSIYPSINQSPRSIYPSINLSYDQIKKIYLYPTDEIIVYGGGLDSIDCGLGWQRYNSSNDYNRSFMVRGIVNRPVEVKLCGNGYIKMRIIISNYKDLERRY